MVTPTRLLGACVAFGGAALLAGIGIVADVANQYDHRWGYGLIGVGLLLAGGCGALWICMGMGDGESAPSGAGSVRADARKKSIAVGGNVGQITQNFGPVIIAGQAPTEDDHVPRAPEPRPPMPPVLELGVPEETRAVPIFTFSDGKATQIDSVDLWRVRVSNTTESTKALDVTVWLEFVEPKVLGTAVPLHKTGDDIWPYEKQFTVRAGEPIYLDVLAKSSQADRFYLWRSDQPSYVFEISPGETKILCDHLVRSGGRLTLKAIADPPTQTVTKEYAFARDVDGRIHLEEAKVHGR